MTSTIRGVVSALWLCLAIACCITPLRAQGGGSFDLEKLMPNARAGSTLNNLLTSEQVPTDNVVDAAVYFVGPGDLIAYQTTALDFTEKLTVVTPENTLLLERYGLINVDGMTLKQVRDTITSIVQARSRGTVECFVTLRRPRLVYVTLKGNVPYPGTYTVPASMRVSTLLAVARQPWLLRRDAAVGEQVRAAGSMTETSKVQELTRNTGSGISPYAARNIVVRHRKGSSSVDLLKAKLTGFAMLDPHVREGDEIVVPYEDKLVAAVAISGAVANPVTISYKPGDKVSLLLDAAGGPTPDADLARVTLVQSGGDGKISLQVDSMLHLTGEDVELQPGSTIIVERLAVTGAAPRQGVVEVYGEVRQPGATIIVPGETRLADVLKDAGGITEHAALALAYVVRQDPLPNNAKEMYDNATRRLQYSDLTLEDTLRFRIDQTYRLPYVSCDFVKAFANPSSSDNIILENGDIIVVPKTPERVYVYGQVHQPGYVSFVPKQPLSWYVDRAGGFAKGAKPGRARIIKGKTRVWVESNDDIYVEPGDEVYVPRSPDVPAGTEIQTYAVIAGIVSSITALIGLFYTILR